MSSSPTRLPTRARVVFGAAALWQLASWGGRISLLTEAERFDAWNWGRIGGSLVFAVLLGVVAVRARHRSAREVAVAFLVFSLVLWGRSLGLVWSEPNELGFRLVHSALAVITWSLAVGCFRASRPSDVSIPG